MPALEPPQAASAMHFDSDQLPARDRISFTREVLGRACAKLEIEPVGDARFRFVSKFQSLPGLRVVTIESSPVRVTRSSELIAGDDNDDFVVAIPLKGKLSVSPLQADVRVGASALVRNTTRGYFQLGPAARVLTISVPSAVLDRHVQSPDLLKCQPRNAEALHLLMHYLPALRDIKSDCIARAAVAHVHDLLGLMFEAQSEEGEARSTGIRLARLRALKADIRLNLLRGDLSIDRVAVRNGISPRYVQLLFAEGGETFTQFVASERLSRACRMLGDSSHAHLSITEVAMETGFDNLSYFNRRFRRAFGLTPRDVRAGQKYVGAAIPPDD
ncbi:AraC family transcriptional regulator [Bradyrhizobium genosp. L]|uniref:AraC family transcriptional regulator n=1 Tax=Bradyrhizobium genosp. L TaxID=83637 RepID=UPI0018A2D518|nr:AraC family transcriptional regulator [Bradyrhizobium genosp. L]QPF82750.1 AraC family transcriptional regulator [Bradyrhizobium genosp. L]